MNADNLTATHPASAARLRFVLCSLFFVVGSLFLGSQVSAAVPKTGGIYEISDDLAAGTAGSVDLGGGNIVLSGSIGQVAVSSAGASGKEVESGYFSRYVSSPSAFAFAAVYRSSVSVTVADAAIPNPSATVYTVEASSASDFSGTVVPASSAVWPAPVTGLAGNTTYYTRVRASYMGMDPSPYTPVSEFLTLPATPVPSGFSNVFYSSLTVSWDVNGNSSQTQYSAQVGSDPGFTVGTFALTYASSYTFEGLSPDSTYYVRVKAVGSLGDETAYSLFGSTITTSVTPSTSVACAVSSTALTAYWDYNGNPYGTGYLAQVSSDNFSTVLASTRTVNDFAFFDGLSPNTTHYLRVASLNASGAPSVFAALPGALTSAAPPLKKADSFPSVGAFTAGLQWLANSNPPQTEYLAEISTASDFSVTAVIAPGWTAGASVSAVGLDPMTIYYFRAKARNAAGIETGYTDLGSTSTAYGTDISSPVITANQGGDSVWRSSNTAVYHIDLADSGGSLLDMLQIKASSGPGGTGTAAFGWSSVVTGINANSFTAGWGLTPAQWTLLGPGTNYISVRAYDYAGNYSDRPDAFYILKDTSLPLIADNQPGESVWRKADPGAIYLVDFADEVSGLSAVEYSASNTPGSADAGVLAWTPLPGLTPGATYYNGPWALNFGALASGVTNYISVRAKDLAGGMAQRNDIFLVLKNTGGPVVTITAPNAAYYSALTAISGTAAPVLTYSITGTELTIQNKNTNLYWDGAGFNSAPQLWLTASGVASWSYNTALIPWASNVSYQVVARSSDTAQNYSAPYATYTFTFDRGAPSAFISTPAAGATVETPALMSGTAADSAPNAGVPYVSLTLRSKSDLKWWNFFTGSWVDSPVSTVTAGGAAWSYHPDDALKGNLLNGGTYYLYVSAIDGAVPPNSSPAGLYASTFTVSDTTPPGAVTAVSGARDRLPGKIDLSWTASGDDGTSGVLAYGNYVMAYSTVSGTALSTQNPQVLFSTGGVMPGSAQSYAITDLTPGVTYYLRIWAQDEAGLWSAPSGLITAMSGLRLANAISGNVRTPSRQGVTGVIVEAINRDLAVVKAGFTVDDGSGTFMLDGLDTGIYRLQASWMDPNGFISSVASDQIPTGYAGVDFELSVDYQLASIGGDLPGYGPLQAAGPGRQAGYGARAAAVSVELYQNGRLVAVAPVGAGGKFLIKNLLPGSYMLKVPDGSGGYKDMAVKLKPGEALQINPQGELLNEDAVYAFPNPARRVVTFHVESGQPSLAKQVTVFDLAGRAIKEFKDADFLQFSAVAPYSWNAVWNIPQGVASGVYLYSARVKSAATGESRKTVKKFAIVK